MKKILLLIIATLSFTLVSAQEGGFKLGAHVGIPTGDIKDFVSVNIGLDVAYLWKVESAFDLGLTTGYSNFLGKKYDTGFGEFKAQDSAYLPIAATGQYKIGDNFFLGADLGYAVFLNNDGGDTGGFLYQPKLGFSFDNTDLYLSYKGISVDGGTFSSVNLGLAIKL